MRYLIVSIFGLFISFATTIFLNVYEQKKETPNLTVRIQNLVVFKTPKRCAYIASIFVCVIATGIYLMVMFPAIHLLRIMKLQTLVALLAYFCYTDLKYRLVPNQMILIGLGVRICFLISELIWMRESFVEIVKQLGFGVLIIGGFFILCTLISKNGFGMGDVKLFILMASYQGLTGALPAIGTSFVYCFLVSIFLIVIRKKTRKDYIPLAPFVFVGTLTSIALIGY